MSPACKDKNDCLTHPNLDVIISSFTSTHLEHKEEQNILDLNLFPLNRPSEHRVHREEKMNFSSESEFGI